MQQVKAADKVEIIDERAWPAKRGLYLLAAVVILCSITFFFGIGRLALTGPDEPRYAEVAREMYVRGDYISPRLAGCLWFEKPALVYWLAAASYGLFGVGEFAARFPAASCALITSLLIFYGLHRARLTVWAVAAAVALATSGLFLGFARAITMDMVLTWAIAIAMMAGYRAAAEAKSRLFFWAVCGGAAGLSVLAKGFVGIILIGAVLGLYIIAAGRWKEAGKRDLAVAVVAMMAVAGAWYVPVAVRHGQAFIDEFIIEHHFQRYLTTIHRHPQPFYFFLFVIIAGLMPWSFLLIPAVARIKSLRPRSGERDSLLTFAWIWAAVPTLFFSLSGSKLPGYILPVFPALAIIIGAELERVWKGEKPPAIRVALWLTALLLFAIGIAFIIYVGQQEAASAGWQRLVQWAPLAASLVAAAALALSRTRVFLGVACGVALLVVAGSVVLLLPKLSYTLSYKALSLEAAARLRPGEKMGFYRMKEFAPIFYGEGRVVCDPTDGTVLNALNPDRLASELERESSIIIFTEKNWLEQLESDGRFNLEPLGEQRKAAALRVSLKADDSPLKLLTE